MDKEFNIDLSLLKDDSLTLPERKIKTVRVKDRKSLFQIKAGLKSP